MKVEKLIVGQLQANCYLVYDERLKESLIIDPGDDADYILRRIADLKLRPKLIVATHGHIDHILAASELKLAFKIPFLIHQDDIFLLKQAPSSSRYWLGFSPDPVIRPDGYLKDGQKIAFSNFSLKVLETPGHTPGSVCFYSGHPRGGVASAAHPGGDSVLFSGDTLFAEGVGRTDFHYASEEKLAKSLKKIFKLPGNLRIYPGHGQETTMAEEKFRQLC